METVNFELFGAFIFATALLVLMPGPVVTLVVANSLKHGTRFGVITSIGANLGTMTLLIAGGIGLSALLTLMSDLFDFIRIAGAAYLVYLGIREWRSRGAMLQEAEADRRRSLKKVFLHGYLTGVTNPKTVIFYVAFFPQFMDSTLPAAPQLVVMTAAFLMVAVLLDGAYALLAGRIRPFLMDARRAVIRARLTGSLLIATGVGLFLTRGGSTA